MRKRRGPVDRTISRTAIALTLAAAALAARHVAGPAQAAEPAGTPAFTSPTRITNPYLPVVPGAVKVYRGAERGAAVMTIETHLTQVRDFQWSGRVVTCRIVEQIEFLRGIEKSRARTYLAQSDDGAVWAFGEVEDDDSDTGEDGPDDPGGWIVGQRSPADPPDVVAAEGPSMLMPGSPSPGLDWISVDLAPSFGERRRVEGVADSVRLPEGRRPGCVRLLEEDLVDRTTDTRWFAPGLGLVRARGPRDVLTLAASTIRPGR